jgi:hypothetical protein
MSSKYKVSDKSIELRNQILNACKDRLIKIADIARLLNSSTYSLSFHIGKLVKSGHLKEGKVKSDINQDVNAYIAIKDVYIPEDVMKAEKEFISPFGRIVRFEAGTKESLALAENLIKRDREDRESRKSPKVHIGGTSSMLARYAHD